MYKEFYFLSYFRREPSELSKKIILDEDKNSLIINEQNRNISGGEKQAIALIRALNKKCDLLILDEPTSAIDVKK